MEEMFKERMVTIDDVINVRDGAALDRLMCEQAADESEYHGTLEVSFDYWHFGRHAEHAAQHGMYVLAALFSAAWQVQHRVLGVDDPIRKHAERLAIAEVYREQIKRYRDEVKTCAAG